MRLTKHHGLGNDFLVLLDMAGDTPVDPELVRQMCGRHTGVGADGLIRATRPAPGDGPPPDAVMELYNADGSRAEMSGNGIRCLAQALLLDEWVADKPGDQDANGNGAEPTAVVIATDAGRRTVARRGAVDATTQLFAVDMGPVRFDGPAPEWTGGPVTRAAWADMGNPHLVLLVDPFQPLEGIDLVALGEEVNRAVPQGANVHLVQPGPDDDAITIRTYERGVGLTQACGTGASASAAVAHSWNLVGEQVDVHMPGGVAQVRLGPSIELTGPATVVAAVEYPFGG
jgi:diaminopimelate epimerase